MAGSFIGKSIEFLIGLIILPRLVTLIWILIVPYFGLGAQTAIIANLVISAVLIIITFFIRKTVAIGFLIGTVWDIIAGYLVLSG
jgi:hypothetical protein